MEPMEFDRLMTIAAGREMEAYEFYSMAASRVTDVSVKEMFTELAGDELGHYERIARYRADPSSAMRICAPAKDWKIAESEPLPLLGADMKPSEAIALAMKKEQQAVEFYRGMAGAAIDEATRSMFDNLANMELGHKRRLEEIFIDIGYPEVF